MKQIIVVRHDLKLSKGKMAAQVAHASVEAVLHSPRDKIDEWLDDGAKKIVLRADSVAEVMALQQKAKGYKLVASLIRDAGKTQLPEGTITCLGIGPDKDELIDKVTGHLKMLN